jgi:hypothetical protein
MNDGRAASLPSGGSRCASASPWASGNAAMKTPTSACFADARRGGKRVLSPTSPPGSLTFVSGEKPG